MPRCLLMVATARLLGYGQVYHEATSHLAPDLVASINGSHAKLLCHKALSALPNITNMLRCLPRKVNGEAGVVMHFWALDLLV